MLYTVYLLWGYQINSFCSKASLMRLVSWKFVPRQVFWPPFEQVVNDLCFHFMLQIHFGDRIGCMHPVSEFRERLECHLPEWHRDTEVRLVLTCPPLEVFQRRGEIRGLSGLQLLPTISHYKFGWGWRKAKSVFIRLDSPKSHIFRPLGSKWLNRTIFLVSNESRRGNQSVVAACDGLITKLCLSNHPCKSKGGESPEPRSTRE